MIFALVFQFLGAAGDKEELSKMFEDGAEFWKTLTNPVD